MLQLTNPDTEIYKMEMTFRSCIELKNGEIKQIGEPLMNEQGIASIIGQVQAIVNQVTILSSFEKRDIAMLMNFLSDTLAKDLMMNRKVYKMSEVTRQKVYFIALSISFSCMKRALNNGERGFWKNSQREFKTTVEGTSQQRGLKGLLNWGK